MLCNDVGTTSMDGTTLVSDIGVRHWCPTSVSDTGVRHRCPTLVSDIGVPTPMSGSHVTQKVVYKDVDSSHSKCKFFNKCTVHHNAVYRRMKTLAIASSRIEQVERVALLDVFPYQDHIDPRVCQY
jgi:hypothetical protein